MDNRENNIGFAPSKNQYSAIWDIFACELNTVRGIRNPANDWNPESSSTDKEYGI